MTTKHDPKVGRMFKAERVEVIDELQTALDTIIDIEHRVAMGQETSFEDLQIWRAAEKFCKIVKNRVKS